MGERTDRPTGGARRPWLILAAGAAVLALVAPAPAQVVRQVTDTRTGLAGPAALDDAGSVVFTGSSTNQLGGNPEHAFQVLRFDPASGAGTALTSEPDGVAGVVSVTDDGSWLAFSSPADLVGSNHDRSPELFVMSADGTDIRQLTDHPAVNAGSVGAVMIAGGGGRIAFTANTDPLGLNPQQVEQLFVIDFDGSGLAQLTAAAADGFGAISISDDGERIAFAHGGDLTGGNPDGSGEIFRILADGTGLLQLTAATEGASGGPALAGNGSTIAFQSSADLTGGNPDAQTEVFLVGFDGAGLRQLTTTNALLDFGDPTAAGPSITDDGGTIVFFSNHYIFPFTNIDSNFEIWSIRADGSGLRALTASAISVGSLLPTISGSGNRVAFLTLAEFGGSNPDGNPELYAMEGDGGSKRQLTDTTYSFNLSPDITPDGSLVVFVNDPDPLFGGGELFRVGADGAGLEQITDLADGEPATPSIAGDNATIVFAAEGDIWRVQADGTGLDRLTSTGDEAAQHPVIAADASRIVFDADADLTGGNPDLGTEVFAMAADGSGIVQVTASATGTSRFPRVDAAGEWLVFESDADLLGGNPDGSFEIFRARTDGTGLAAVTSDPLTGARRPDVDDSGELVAWHSAADPLGTNPEGNSEIFLRDVAAATTRQLTDTAEGGSFFARISGDGAWVYFLSDAPFFEQDPDEPTDVYRVPAAGGPVERVGGLRLAGVAGVLSTFGLGAGTDLAVDGDGSRAALAAIANYTGDNPDLLPEIWVIDRETEPVLRISRETPTVVSWTVESGPLRYDVIRGNVAALGPLPGGGVDLGPVACLEDDSPDATTAGDGDPLAPGPGEAFFYLYRGTPGLQAGPGSYGTGSGGGERQPASGDCP
jgi:Tol biopolymer transport system component